MTYEGPDRRSGTDDEDTGERRRWEDAMNYLRKLDERVEDLENEMRAFRDLPMAVGRVQGAQEVTLGRLNLLIQRVDQGFDTVTDKVDRPTSWKTLLVYVSGVLVPIIVTLIGGYFALKASVVSGSK